MNADGSRGVTARLPVPYSQLAAVVGRRRAPRFGRRRFGGSSMLCRSAGAAPEPQHPRGRRASWSRDAKHCTLFLAPEQHDTAHEHEDQQEQEPDEIENEPERGDDAAEAEALKK